MNVCVIIIIIFLITFKYYRRHKCIFIKPIWGIGNRLRALRVCHYLAKRLNMNMCIIESKDEGFDCNMSDLLYMPYESISQYAYTKFVRKAQTIYSISDDHELSKNCIPKRAIRDLPKRDLMYIKGCGLDLTDGDNDDRSFYDVCSPKLPPETQRFVEEIASKKAVGIHVRQGNVNDWDRGYFFGPWNDKKEDPASSPQFCCFDDESKNVSSCPKTHIEGIEKYVEKMKTYSEDTVFYVCSDRPGCSMYLHQMFPGRILTASVGIFTEQVETKEAWRDFCCLAACTEIVSSRVSSFSDEARRMGNIPLTLINK